MFGHCSQRTKILRKAIGTGKEDGGRGDNWFQIPYCLTVVTLLKKWAGFPAGGGGTPGAGLHIMTENTYECKFIV